MKSISGEQAVPIAANTISDLRHLSMLLERLGPLEPQRPGGARADAGPFEPGAAPAAGAAAGAPIYGAMIQSPREALVAQILAVAAIAARSGGELGSALEGLRAAGGGVPAGGVIGEAMVALVLASAMREKFGGDSLGEMKRNWDGYREQLRGY